MSPFIIPLSRYGNFESLYRIIRDEYVLESYDFSNSPNLFHSWLRYDRKDASRVKFISIRSYFCITRRKDNECAFFFEFFFFRFLIFVSFEVEEWPFKFSDTCSRTFGTERHGHTYTKLYIYIRERTKRMIKHTCHVLIYINILRNGTHPSMNCICYFSRDMNYM